MMLQLSKYEWRDRERNKKMGHEISILQPTWLKAFKTLPIKITIQNVNAVFNREKNVTILNFFHAFLVFEWMVGNRMQLTQRNKASGSV